MPNTYFPSINQFINAVSQDTALEIEVPYRFMEWGPVRYWVEYSNHFDKERLMTQNNLIKWSSPKSIALEDIIILQYGEKGLLKPMLVNFKVTPKETLVQIAEYFVFNKFQKQRLQAQLKDVQINWKPASVDILEFEIKPRKNGTGNLAKESAKSKKRRKTIWLLMYRQQVFPSETPEGYRARFEAWDANCPVRKHEYEFKEYNRFKTDVEIKEKVYDAIFDEVRLQELGVDMDKYRAIVGSV